MTVTSLTHRGWPVLRLISDQLQVDLVPGQGGTILQLRRRLDDLAVLGQTPWGLRPYGAVPPPASATAQAMETWAGGWRTLFPNAGRSSVANGVELGETGEACLAGYDWIEVDDGIQLTTRLSRVPFVLNRTVTLVDDAVTVTESVRNVGGEDVTVMWGQQLMFTAPVIGPSTTVDSGATIVRPDTDVVSSASWDDLMPWPRAHGVDGLINLRTLPAPDADETRRCYLTDFTESRLSVRNVDLDLEVNLTWNSNAWPYAWYDLEAGRDSGFPWYKAGYFLALGPASSWPARGVHEAERLSELLLFHPDDEKTATLTVAVRPAS